jgi:serine protease
MDRYRPLCALSIAVFLILILLAPLVIQAEVLPRQSDAYWDSASATVPTAQESTMPTDQIVVRFRGPVDLASPLDPGRDTLLRQVREAAGIQLAVERAMSGGGFVLKLPSPLPAQQVAAISQLLEMLYEVEYAEPDLVKYVVGDPSRASLVPMPQTTPSDPSYLDQWHYRYVPGTDQGLNLPAAWSISTGSADIVVAVIDTGIVDHADLAGRTVPGYDFISNVFVANDGDGRDADPSDPGDWRVANQCYLGSPARNSSWHGTHVAGTIGAASNNGVGVTGVDWNARILPIRVLGRCGGYTSDIVDGSRWAAGLPVPGVPDNPNPAQVLNLSLQGSGPCSTTEQNAYNEIVAAGTTVVVAAGNSNADVSGTSPANCANVITVAATDRSGDRAYYSNYGSLVEVSAPGGETPVNPTDGVLSTLNAGTTTPASDVYAFYQGTSMATPHVAGLASLLLGQWPSATPAQVLQRLQDTARAFPMGSGCATGTCGVGIVDAYQALSGWPPPLPDAPALVAPASGSMTNDDTPTFDWSAVSGGAQYQIHVDDDAGFASPEIAVTTSATGHAPLTGLADDTYNWRVRAQSSTGSWGNWSATWTLTIDTAPPAAPTLQAPADGATTNDDAPTFDWDPVTGGAQYQLQVDDGAGFTSPEIAVTGSGTDHTPPTGLMDDTYNWRVRAQDNVDNWGNWSPTWTLTIDTVPPAAPTLQTPADGATTNDDAPTFDWDPVTGGAQYLLQVDDGADFASPEIAITGSGTDYTPPTSLADDTYSWRVRVQDNAGNWGNWSPIWTVTVDTTVTCISPSTPDLTSPQGGSLTDDTMPVFTWNAAQDASEYQFQLDRDTGFGSPISDTVTTVPSFTVDSPLSDGTYYWRVRGHNTADSCDEYGAWSIAWRVTIDTPLSCNVPHKPELISPQDGSSTSDPTPSLTWDPVGDASAYQIQVHDDNDWGSPAIDRVTSDASYTLDAVLNHGAYYWRVRSRNAADGCDVYSAWSGTWGFTIDVIASNLDRSLFLPLFIK